MHRLKHLYLEENKLAAAFAKAAHGVSAEAEECVCDQVPKGDGRKEVKRCKFRDDDRGSQSLPERCEKEAPPCQSFSVSKARSTLFIEEMLQLRKRQERYATRLVGGASRTQVEVRANENWSSRCLQTTNRPFGSE